MSGTIITRVPATTPATPQQPATPPAPVPPRVPVPLLGGDTVRPHSHAPRGTVPVLESGSGREIPLLSPDKGEPPRPWFDQRGYALTHTRFAGETGDVATTGGRVELETTLVEGKVGRVAAVAGMTASVGNRSFHVNPALGVRGELGNRDKLAVYSTVMGGANIGAMNGQYTDGWQARVAGGVEHKFLFAEYAYERATNYTSHGVSVGLRLHF